MTDEPTPRARIGVVPASEHARRPRLLAALEQAYPVRFEPRGEGEWRDLDGVVAIGAEGAAALERSPAPAPALIALGDERAEAGPAVPIALSDDPRLSRPLRSAHLTDAHVAPQLHGSEPVGNVGPTAQAVEPSAVAELLGSDPSTFRGAILATAADRPAWTRLATGDAPIDVVASAPLELEEPEALRDRLAPGRNLAVLALAHFLAERTAGRRFEPQGPRAAIVLDDPNLHWPTYGRVRYPELIRHAAEHRYHVSFAMVPLDGWLVHPRVARLFGEGAEQVSICVHGNDHTGPELGRPASDAEGAALAAQALRRMERLERRTGLRVSRVMVPPHERVSEPAARGLRACGYDAICTTRPYPWMVSQLRAPWLTRPPEAGPLAGWHSVDVVAGGLPVLLRSSFEHPREDLVLRAFLGQPLILYGHHDDLRDGMDVLAAGAADVNALGDVRWCSLGDMAQASVETLRIGDTLHVRPRARRVRVDVPEGVERVVVNPSVMDLGPDAMRATPAGASPATLSEGATDGGIAVHRPGTLALTCGPDPQLPSPTRTAPHRRLWPIGRRLASEARDRVAGVR